MKRQLDALESELLSIEEQLSDPETVKDSAKLQTLMRRYGEILPIVERYREYKQILEREKEAREILESESDEELVKLAQEELEKIVPIKERFEEELAEALIPKDLNDGKDLIVEIRAGTGGEEAALFARDLCRMYLRYAERKGWKAEIVYESPSALGGYKEVILHISGRDAWKLLRYESGVHRVQRIPVTESSGRIHTSAATVAILPEAEEAEVEIREEELEIETFRSSGPGGQHMQKNETAVRIKHKPTGLVVECQDERSQHQNKMKALRILKTRLLEMKRREQEAEIQRQRREQIKSGDRSDKDRTYNFIQNRVTDHRYEITLYKLKDILDGDLDELLYEIRRKEIKQWLMGQESETVAARTY
ncbi:MAG: peptide chain release factor 1 [Armatimonadetes bacterium]|nr:peptide chain release factor 1 [Armatimonadota bacterium]MDW8028288.1 peptide chain release factor 1 [Armatimonadota bacterium]